MKKLIERIPLPMAGLMLAFAATGNLVLPYGALYRNILGILSASILLLILTKAFTNTAALFNELKNPVIASVSPTFSMGLMLLSVYLKPYMPYVALVLWSLGLAIHVLLMGWFTVKFILNFEFKKVFPSYFIVYVGIVVASVTAPAYNLLTLGKIIFWFGFAAYIVLLPIVLYRVFIFKNIPEAALPTITICAAPASLCLAGYVSSFEVPSIVISGFLMILSITMFTGVLLYLPKMLMIKFYPSFSAFTFPIAISAIATKKYYGAFAHNGMDISFLKYVAHMQEILTVLILIYVSVKYAQFILDAKPTTIKSGLNDVS